VFSDVDSIPGLATDFCFIDMLYISHIEFRGLGNRQEPDRHHSQLLWRIPTDAYTSWKHSIDLEHTHCDRHLSQINAMSDSKSTPSPVGIAETGYQDFYVVAVKDTKGNIPTSSLDSAEEVEAIIEDITPSTKSQ
jgi:hypothetical protein